MRRIGRDDGMAGIAGFLASRADPCVNGAIIPVDGGIATTASGSGSAADQLTPLTTRDGQIPSGTPPVHNPASGRGPPRSSMACRGPVCAVAAPRRHPDDSAAPRPLGGQHQRCGTIPRFGEEPLADAEHPAAHGRAAHQVGHPVQVGKQTKPVARQRGYGAEADTVHAGAANSQVRSPTCSSTRSAPISRRLASCAGRVANSPRSHARRGLIVDRAGPPRTPPERRLRTRSTVVGSPSTDSRSSAAARQQRHRDTARPSEHPAELVDVGQGPVADPDTEHDELSSHIRSVATAGVGTVSVIKTSGVHPVQCGEHGLDGGDDLGASGSVRGQDRLTTLPPGASRNFSKFHSRIGLPAGVGGPGPTRRRAGGGRRRAGVGLGQQRKRHPRRWWRSRP